MVSKLLKINPINNSISEVEKKVLLKKISETADLPIQSIIIDKVIKLLRTDKVDIDSVIHEVEKDQVLVAQILKIINTGGFSSDNVKSTREAINLIGIESLKKLVFGISAKVMYGKVMRDEWKHSYSSSLLMTQLIDECGIDIVSKDLALTMLVHDIGLLILRKYNPTKYELTLQTATKQNLFIYDAEKLFFKIDHSEAAKVLLEKWNMPESLIQPVLWHHRYDDVPEKYVLETALVQFVDWVDSKARDIPISFQGPCPMLLRAAGIEEVDKIHWVVKQRKNIARIDREMEQ